MKCDVNYKVYGYTIWYWYIIVLSSNLVTDWNVFFLFVRVSFFCKGYCKECASGPLWNLVVGHSWTVSLSKHKHVCVCIWIMVPVEVRIRSARVLLHDSHMKIPPVKLFPWVSLSISFRLGFVCWLVLCWFIMTWFAAYLHHFCCFVWLCMTLGLTLW